jgi:3-deoxy-7-phosphoheptulonate synthase
MIFYLTTPQMLASIGGEFSCFISAKVQSFSLASLRFCRTKIAVKEFCVARVMICYLIISKILKAERFYKKYFFRFKTAHFMVKLFYLAKCLESIKRGGEMNNGKTGDESKKFAENYRLASREFHKNDTIVEADGARFGGENFSIIAGPCAVESEEQIFKTAESVKKSGAKVLRGGAFKPRTSPYGFQGLEKLGLKLLIEAKHEFKIPVASEIIDPRDLDLFADIDIVQVGARNMQNFALLRELSRSKKPILLKRGFCATISELLASAEYLLLGGNPNVILCERGVRTFEPIGRFTLDVCVFPFLKKHTHLPIIADPSHACGDSSLVSPLARAVAVAGSNGLIIEVHPQPQTALCDGAESLNFEEFEALMKEIK